MSAIVHSFSQALRLARQQARWSQETLAARANLNRTYVGDLERGQAVPSLVTLHKLAQALDVPLASLLAHAEHLAHRSVGNADSS